MISYEAALRNGRLENELRVRGSSRASARKQKRRGTATWRLSEMKTSKAAPCEGWDPARRDGAALKLPAAAASRLCSKQAPVNMMVERRASDCSSPATPIKIPERGQILPSTRQVRCPKRCDRPLRHDESEADRYFRANWRRLDDLEPGRALPRGSCQQRVLSGDGGCATITAEMPSSTSRPPEVLRDDHAAGADWS